MSTKQAFARVPRGKNRGNSSAIKANVTRIDAKWLSDLERAKTNPDLGTVMTKTSTELIVGFNAQGLSGFNLQDKSGRVMADQTDIVRIQTLNTSITKERKEAQKSEVSETLKYVLAAFVRKCIDGGLNLVVVPPTFLEVYRGVNTTMSALARNINALELVEVVKDSANDTIKKMLCEYGKRIRIAVGKFLFHRLMIAEGEVPRKINRFLSVEQIPFYFYGKLTNASGLGVNQVGFDIRTLLFPNDPSKGFFLTFRECQDSGIFENAGGILAGADLMFEIAWSQPLIRRLINVSDDKNLINFDEEGSLAAKMAGVPFWVPPFPGAVDRKYIFNFLAKNGVRGVNWQSGSVLSPQDNLKFVGTIAKRMSYGLLSRPSLKADLLGRMFPQFQFDRSNEEARDIYVQLKTWSQTNDPEYNWMEICTNKTKFMTQSVVSAVFADVTALGSDHAISIIFNNQRREAHASLPITPGEFTEDIDLFTDVKNLAINLRAAKEDPLKIIGSRYSGKLGRNRPKIKGTENTPGTNRAGMTERSVLTQKSKECLALMKQRGYGILAERMMFWFRQFLSTDIQSAVADLFAARLDAFLSAPIQLNREDRLAFMEPDATGVENLDEDDTESPHESDHEEEDLARDNPDDE